MNYPIYRGTVVEKQHSFCRVQLHDGREGLFPVGAACPGSWKERRAFWRTEVRVDAEFDFVILPPRPDQDQDKVVVATVLAHEGYLGREAERQGESEQG